ncbi:unnamed protein product [Lactuca saligna]|uniref:Uncharacterized protein n=1 Tax=Lactuca saligna TaxID=75948 RepID=A0AA35YL81_LACSI|nr:unnamed protein product [Lactuca saligna]
MGIKRETIRASLYTVRCLIENNKKNTQDIRFMEFLAKSTTFDGVQNLDVTEKVHFDVANGWSLSVVILSCLGMAILGIDAGTIDNLLKTSNKVSAMFKLLKKTLTKEFVDTVYSLESDSLESELDVYIDHRNEPILDWADNKLLADGKGYDSDELDEEDDKDYEASMTMEYEHEWDDEEEHTFDKTIGDPFLDKLSGHITDDDEEEANNGKLKDVVFPVHNENQEWEQMVPVLGMKFSNPLELKL